MALGTPTVRDSADAFSNLFEVTFDIPGDGAYPTGGTPNMSTVVSGALASQKKGLVNVVAILGSAPGYLVNYDAQNDKLVVLNLSSNGAQVSNATDLSGTTFRLTAFYR